jgi:hypothetical protein
MKVRVDQARNDQVVGSTRDDSRIGTGTSPRICADD